MSQVLIRQIPDDYAESTGLAKYNRSRMPGCVDRFAAGINSDGRFITGIDDEAIGVNKEEAVKIKELREFLEKKTGKDLNGLSSFWESFFVTIESDKPKLFNKENALDIISLKLLISNKYVAPDKDSASNPEYRNAKYYAYTEESEASEEMSIAKKRDRAKAELLKISENKDKMVLYGQYLEGLKYNAKLSEDTLYKLLRAFIEDKDIKNAENFLAAMSKSVEELQQKVIIDRAIKQRLITKSGTGKRTLYQYGQTTLGSSIDEVYRNLAMAEFTPELHAMQTQLDEK